MTARQVWEGLLTELSKVNAPSMLLEDFNYFFNKAINQYINKRYNINEVNQLITDDLRVLKSTTILEPKKATGTGGLLEGLQGLTAGASKMFDATFEVNLPDDYMHLLNCICIYQVKSDYKCYNRGDYVQYPATRLTADAWSIISNDYYHRPLPSRPYYYIHNVNTSENIPTNPYHLSTQLGTDTIEDYSFTRLTKKVIFKQYSGTNDLGLKSGDKLYLTLTYDRYDNLVAVYKKNNKKYIMCVMMSSGGGVPEIPAKENTTWYYDFDAKDEDYYEDGLGQPFYPGYQLYLESIENYNFPRTIDLPNKEEVSLVNKPAGLRHSNASKVRLEIRYGHDASVFELKKVFIDYIKSPLFIRLTQELVNLTEDTSQIMEFPDYVCQEIINELVLLVMENTADPRFQTHTLVTQSIANPAQQLAQPATQKSS